MENKPTPITSRRWRLQENAEANEWAIVADDGDRIDWVLGLRHNGNLPTEEQRERLQRLVDLHNGTIAPAPSVFRDLDAVLAELARAAAKFPTWPTDPLHALAVLGEEFGELTKAVLQRTYEPRKGVELEEIRGEAIQTAAMAMRFVMSLDRYRYAPGDQHEQATEPEEDRPWMGEPG